MRLAILDHDHTVATKLLFVMIRLFSRQPVLDVIKLVRYRPGFYGRPMSQVTHEAMRGPSSWSIGDRELMAAYVAKSNACEWCTRAHTATAEGAYRDSAKVAAVLADLDTALVDEKLRATLRLLGKLTRTHAIDAGDVRTALSTGVSREQLEDAFAVCFSFNVIGRLADAFSFSMPTPEAFTAGARFLLARGYR
jgi:AhpD family alkylhydroperoxidase